MRNKLIFTLIFILVLFTIGFFSYREATISINKIALLPQKNPSIEERFSVVLSRKASISVKYWVKGSSKHLQKTFPKKKKSYQFKLMFLQPDTTYKFRVVVNQLVKRESTIKSFSTIKQPPWMTFNWFKKGEPHDGQAVGNGLIMLTRRKIPGTIMMVDNKGAVRWFWRADSAGVKVANLTPQGNIIALLGKPNRKKEKNISAKTKEMFRTSKYPLRSGRIGYLGGYTIVEINLNGKIIRRIDLKHRKNPIIIHHDIRMDKKGNIYAIYRDPLHYTMPGLNKDTVDTLWGDGIVKIGKKGKIKKKWSVWDNWDIKNDPKLPRFAYDRFHLNSLFMDSDGNYLVSSAIESQIWKINKNSGKIIWKLGKKGDFKMKSADYFSFQHDAHINRNGNLTIFDNGAINPFDSTKTHKRSRMISFKLDTTRWKADKVSEIDLPQNKYTSRMGSAYLLPNGNYLLNSTKKGYVVVTDTTGNILWNLDMPFMSYRAEYIPAKKWKFWRSH